MRDDKEKVSSWREGWEKYEKQMKQQNKREESGREGEKVEACSCENRYC